MAGYFEKRGKNSYRLVVPGEPGADGKRKRYTKTVKCKNDKEAAKQLALFVAAIENGDYFEPSKLTFHQFAQKWFDEYAKPNLAPKTVHRYKEMMNSRIMAELGHLKLDKIKPLHLVEFYNKLRQDGARLDGKKGGLSPQTIRHHHRLIHTMLETAVKWELIKSNPADNVPPPKVKKQEAKFLEEDEVHALLEALKEAPLKYQVAILLTLSAGLREGELMGLRWENVDFNENTIRIIQASQHIPGMGTFIKDPKNDTSKRTIKIPSTVMDLLKQYEIEQSKNKLKFGELYNDTGYVFVQFNGELMNTYSPSKWFREFLKRNNLKHITFHQLRHTSASLLVNAGLDIGAISKRLGHSNKSTTLNIYSHALKSADEAAAEKMEAMMFKKNTSIQKNQA